MLFSQAFNLATNNQENFEFVNIRVDHDNLLFLDPTRIDSEDSARFVLWTNIIQDFFSTIYDLYASGNTQGARSYFGASGESNEIFLGYSEGFPRGKGNSEESLSEAFDYIHNEGLLTDNLVGRLEDIFIFVPEFGPDLLSDLVASLLKRELVLFTREQCELNGIELNQDNSTEMERWYWDHINHKWATFTERVPAIDNYPIVLIPKEILVAKYLYSSDKYWSQTVSVWRQEQHRDMNSLIHQQRAEKKEFASKDIIKKEETQEENLTEKEYLIRMTQQNINLIEGFRENIQNTQRGTNSNKMSDEEFQRFIDDSYEK